MQTIKNFLACEYNRINILLFGAFILFLLNQMFFLSLLK